MVKQAARIIIPVLTAVALTACETLRAADEMLYSVAEQAAPEDRITGARTLNLSTRQADIERGNGRIEQAIKDAKAKNLPLNEAVDAEGYRRLTRILERIHAVSHFADEDGWQVLLLPDESFNAWVNGGTYVVVHKGLLDFVENDDEIAAIIGHEMGHVAAGHISEAMASRLAVTLAGSESAGKSGYSQAFTNINEQEADRIGAVYAALAGYDPDAVPKLWARIAAKSPDNWTFFHDHPASGERTRQTAGYANQVRGYYKPGRVNANAGELLACNKIWCRSEGGTAAGEGGGVMAVLEATFNAWMTHEQAKVERERQAAKIRARQNAGQGSSSSGNLALGEGADGAASLPIRFGAVYTGGLIDARTGQGSRVQTRFRRTSGGEIGGRFTSSVQGRQLSGSLRLIRQVSPGQYLFEWRTSSGGRGLLLSAFTSDGTAFRGDWQQNHPTQARGRWTGESG